MFTTDGTCHYCGASVGRDTQYELPLPADQEEEPHAYWQVWARGVRICPKDTPTDGWPLVRIRDSTIEFVTGGGLEELEE